jgi:hypothetical protein
VVVVNDYTADHDLGRAELVLSGFGDPGAPAEVLGGRAATLSDGVLDLATLTSVLTVDRSG